MFKHGTVAAFLLCLAYLGEQAIGSEIPFFRGADMDPVWLSSEDELGSSKDEVLSLSDFDLLDQYGKRKSAASFKGSVTLINFFFSTCTGICPALMSKVQRVQKDLAFVKGVRIVSISITPELDSPERLLRFAKKRKLDLKNWNLLTGSRTEILRVAKKSFQAAKTPRGQKSPSDFVHSNQIYLLDKELKLRGIYNTNLSANLKDLLRDAAELSNN